jgi:hypothetical protein
MGVSARMFSHLSEKMRSRSAALLLSIDNRLDQILKYWLLIAGIVSTMRIAVAPHSLPIAGFSTFACYLLLVVAPFASTLVALHWFANGHLQPQPTTRLARVGRWQSVGRREAQSHSLYGASGLMVSLIVGMMLNVPVRAAEYVAAMPPLPAAAPHWLSVLHFAMTLDVVIFTSLYMIAFVAALRRVPLFPRLLVAIWLGDLVMQLTTAQMVASTHVPANVAVALQSLLIGNVKKVLISMVLWLPYLLLSTRVNVTYRHRIPA